ncbi:MAG: replication factor C large subunit [Candidatus Pacearchaeota archaeon]
MEEQLPWSEKYRPKRLSEIVGQDEAKFKLLNFIKNFKQQKKKAVLVSGPAGCGKTALAYALASELRLEIIELNASDFRNKEQIQEVVGKALTQKSLFAKGKLILIDELDGISGQEDRGGLPELLKFIEKTNWPVFLVCNDPWQEKLRKVRSKAISIELKPLTTKEVMKILARISNKEKLEISFDALESLASKVFGDARAAINDLQATAVLTKKINRDSLAFIDGREKDVNVLEALKKILKTREARNAFDQVQNLDLDDFFLWLDENLPLEYKGQELEKAYDIMSLADLYRGRITRQQHWRFLSYINDLITQGVAIAKKQEKTQEIKYKQPSRLLKIWWANQKQAKKKEIAKKLAERTHTSVKKAMKEIYLFKLACKNKEFFNNFVRELQLEPEQSDWLKN